ncbi:hypothetical protein LQV63_04965 [Paenibacillus profundus]|uniref:Uncharacterized protein n=1 Tax=Paenibacillus profundus TaxID=1173085 RepID=A0ABS8YCS1_9BACL|nr:hypothetical protein [Paenibacillus profundus]MCE5168664.1 hypothetical protein [Paenibacillus profundus]
MNKKAYNEQFGKTVEQIKTGTVTAKWSGALVKMRRTVISLNRRIRLCSDDKVMRIVADKAKMYYAGQKSLDEVVQFIQSRVITYLNE